VSETGVTRAIEVAARDARNTILDLAREMGERVSVFHGAQAATAGGAGEKAAFTCDPSAVSASRATFTETDLRRYIDALAATLRFFAEEVDESPEAAVLEELLRRLVGARAAALAGVFSDDRAPS
jgi:hypothetical protein